MANTGKKSMEVQRAEAALAQAEKELNKWSLFAGGQDRKMEKAVEQYNKAANLFKAGKHWQDAGEAYCKAADLNLKLQTTHAAAASMLEASKMYKKISPEEYAEKVQSAIALFCEMGRFNRAGKLQEEVAELFEEEMNTDEAIQAYQQAADYFSSEEMTAAANRVMGKVAALSAANGRYAEAADQFKQLGTSFVRKELTKYSAKKMFLNSALCTLARGDPVGARTNLERFRDIDYMFADSPECTFANNVITAVEEGDADAFTDHVYQYDRVNTLEPWKTSLLLTVKRTLQDADDGADAAAEGKAAGDAEAEVENEEDALL